MEELRDIRGLDQISFWPLAYGWWIIIAVFLAILTISIIILFRKIQFQKSWRKTAIEKLEELKNNNNKTEIIGDLFELLKEISIMKYGRKNCANLTGIDWLKWLKENDQNKFDWVLHGKNLIQIQYAPTAIIEESLKKEATRNNLNAIFTAILNMIKKS